jgi:hypothetical protein
MVHSTVWVARHDHWFDLSIKGMKSTSHGMAVAGLTLSIIGLVLTIINAAIGAYLGATGQHPLLQ